MLKDIVFDTAVQKDIPDRNMIRSRYAGLLMVSCVMMISGFDLMMKL